MLDAAVACFWARGYEATSIRDLIERTGVTGASLYNAFGDKRALYRRALDHYVGGSIVDRIRRCEALPPRAAIDAFFAEILKRSLADRERKGCMLVNAALELGALELGPDGPGHAALVADALARIEEFFRQCVEAGQADGTIARSLPAPTLARHLLGVLAGLRTLSRVRPERLLLEDMVRGAFALLDGCGGAGG